MYGFFFLQFNSNWQTVLFTPVNSWEPVSIAAESVLVCAVNNTDKYKKPCDTNQFQATFSDNFTENLTLILGLCCNKCQLDWIWEYFPSIVLRRFNQIFKPRIIWQLEAPIHGTAFCCFQKWRVNRFIVDSTESLTRMLMRFYRTWINLNKPRNRSLLRKQVWRWNNVFLPRC